MQSNIIPIKIKVILLATRQNKHKYHWLSFKVTRGQTMMAVSRYSKFMTLGDNNNHKLIGNDHRNNLFTVSESIEHEAVFKANRIQKVQELTVWQIF